MSVLISQEDYELLQSCKSKLEAGMMEDISDIAGPSDNIVFAPEEYKEYAAVKVSNIQKEISEGSKDFFQEGYNQEEIHKDVISYFSEIQQKDILNFDEENSEKLLQIMTQLKDISSATFLLISDIIDILEEKPKDDALMINFITSVEIFLKLAENYKTEYNAIFSQKENISSTIDNVGNIGKQLQNSICNVIREMIKLDPQIKNSNVMTYFNNNFCPESYGEYKQELKSQGWVSYIKQKTRDVVSMISVHGTGHIFYGMMQNKYTKMMANIFNVLTKHSYTLYIVFVLTSNIGLSSFKSIISGEYSYIDILITIGFAACNSLTDPIIMGKMVRILIEKFLRASSMSILSDKMYKFFGIFMGNAVSYLGPALLSISIQKSITYMIQTICIILNKLAISGYNITSALLKTGTITYQLYTDIMNLGPVDGLKYWIDNRISEEVVNKLTSSMLEVSGYPKYMIEYISESTKNKVFNAYDRGSEGIRNIWSNLSSRFNTVPVGEDWYEKYKHALVVHSCESTGTCGYTTYEKIINGLNVYAGEIKKIIEKIKDIIYNYGEVCSTYISDWLGNVLDRFSKIYKICLDYYTAFIQKANVIYAFYSFATVSYSDMYGSSLSAVEELEKEVNMLKRNNRYLQVKDNVQKLAIQMGTRKRRRT